MEIKFRALILPLFKERDFIIVNSKKVLNKMGILNALVDWDKELLIGVFSGAKPTGGYAISILKLELHEQSLIVHFSEQTPKPGDFVSQALTYSGQWIVAQRREFPQTTTSVIFINQNGIKEKIIPFNVSG